MRSKLFAYVLVVAALALPATPALAQEQAPAPGTTTDDGGFDLGWLGLIGLLGLAGLAGRRRDVDTVGTTTRR